jgi:hypothetical protein
MRVATRKSDSSAFGRRVRGLTWPSLHSQRTITLAITATRGYGPWTNEALVGEALAPVRNEVVIATKFGFDVDPTTGESSAQRTRCCDASARTTSIFSTSTASIRTSPSRTSLPR